MALEIVPPAEGTPYTILRFSGRLDADLAEQHRTDLDGVFTSGARLIGDLTQLRYVSSAGINLLIFIHRQAIAAGGEFRIAGVQRYVSEVLKLAGCTKLFRFYDTVDAAKV